MVKCVWVLPELVRKLTRQHEVKDDTAAVNVYGSGWVLDLLAKILGQHVNLSSSIHWWLDHVYRNIPPFVQSGHGMRSVWFADLFPQFVLVGDSQDLGRRISQCSSQSAALPDGLLARIMLSEEDECKVKVSDLDNLIPSIRMDLDQDVL